MYFNETIQAINAIHILDNNFKHLLEQAKKELVHLKNENEQLKKELNDQRKRNSEEMARNESESNNGSTATTT